MPRPVLVFHGLAVTLFLAACSQTPRSTEIDPYANGVDYPWTYTRPDTALSAQSLTPGENTLFYEPILSATNGWGPLELNRSNGEQQAGDGKTITLNGVTYKKGLGVHAGSEVRYSLMGTGASCVRFTADIGVDDEVGGRGSVVFQVYLDGVKAYDSGVMTGGSATKRPSRDITGKQKLRLVVTDAGNGKSFDHADWANPKVTCVAVGAPTVSVVPGSLDIVHKHTATLKASFTNIGGPVNLRLVPLTDFPFDVTAPGGERPVVLQPTTATVVGAGDPVPLKISAPGLPGFRNEATGESGRLSYTYTLIASQNGRDIARTPVTVNEKLLTLKAGLELPAGVLKSRVPGVLVLTMDVVPTLSETKPIVISYAQPGACNVNTFKVSPVGATYREASLLKQRYSVYCDSSTIDSPVDFYIGVDREWFGLAPVLCSSS